MVAGLRILTLPRRVEISLSSGHVNRLVMKLTKKSNHGCACGIMCITVTFENNKMYESVYEIICEIHVVADKFFIPT